jgi:hypothetical protein
MANRTSPETLWMSSFSMRFERWESTVLSETPSMPAISLLESPSAINCSTSRSRSVSAATPEGAASPGRAIASTTCWVMLGDR